MKTKSETFSETKKKAAALQVQNIELAKAAKAGVAAETELRAEELLTSGDRLRSKFNHEARYKKAKLRSMDSALRSALALAKASIKAKLVRPIQ